MIIETTSYCSAGKFLGGDYNIIVDPCNLWNYDVFVFVFETLQIITHPKIITIKIKGLIFAYYNRLNFDVSFPKDLVYHEQELLIFSFIGSQADCQFLIYMISSSVLLALLTGQSISRFFEHFKFTTHTV